MPVAKLSTTGTLDPMKSTDGNEGIDTFVRQTVGKEPLLSFSRTGDSPVQWIQLLHALDQQELPGWPLLTPLKVQMQKCEKCSREFCSPINYRRHIRVHRRSLNVDKESHKIRDMLAAFWDKLSLEDAKEVVSFKDVMLKEVPGSSVSKALASSLRKPGVWTLPQVYLKAGTTLLDIIHAKPSRLPISSQELFSILDDASERTFLCAGTAESVQKYIFDGEAGKVAFELKNLVACTSFLFELKLLKAWLTDKDAEALRCQKLLVEEEEAAQKRRAELLEKKKQKKLRQKEQKAREQTNGETAISSSADSLEGSPPPEAHSPAAPSDVVADAPEILPDITSYPDSFQLSNNEQNDDIEARYDCNLECLDTFDHIQTLEQPMMSVNFRRRWQVHKSHRTGRNGFHGNHNLQLSKVEASVQKHGPPKDRGPIVNSSKVWAKKFKVENDDDSLTPRSEEVVDQTEEKKCELIIGSISVPVRNSISQKNVLTSEEDQYSHGTEQSKQNKSNSLEEPNNNDNIQSGVNRAAGKHWRPVSRHETRGLFPFQRMNGDSGKGVVRDKLDDRTASDCSCLQSSALDDDHSKSRECIDYPIGGAVPSQFSSDAAKAFLAERWKEAISSDHVTLVLSPDPERPGGAQTQSDVPIAVSAASDVQEISVVGGAESQVPVVGLFSSSGGRSAKGKVRKNPEKGVKIKYIPKQKVAA